MVDVAKTSPRHLENLANVIHKKMVMGKVLAVLQMDGVEIVQVTVIVLHVRITPHQADIGLHLQRQRL